MWVNSLTVGGRRSSSWFCPPSVLFLPLGRAFKAMIILPLDIGGQQYGEVLLTQDYVLEKEITYGKCKSRDLKEIGVVELKEDKAEVIPHRHCLPEKRLFQTEKPKIKEVPFSFFVNYYYEFGKEKPFYSLQPGLYLKGLFLTVYKDREKLRNYRLSYDFPEKDISLSAGYVFFRGFSTIGGYYGKGIVLDRKVLSGEPITGRSHQLVLPTQSEVEVYRNGTLLQRLTLPAGIYDLENLPVSGLTNQLTIRIRDIFGRVREEKLFFLYSPEILRRGKIDFSVGLFRDKQGGYIRYGYSDHLTLNLAGDREKQGLGFDLLTKYGLFSTFGTNKDYELRYLGSFKNFSLAFVFKEKDFRYSFWGYFGNLSVNLYGYRNKHSFVGISLSTSPFRNSYLSLSYSHSSTDKSTLYLTFTYLLGNHSFTSTLGDRGFNFTAQKNLSSQKELDYAYRISHQQNFQTASFTLKSLNIVELRHSQAFGESRQSLSFSGSVGCVYEDGLSCGVGLPVYDAFVVGKNLKSTYGNAFSLLPVPSYQNLKVFSEVDLKMVTFEGALRQGQGYAIGNGYDALVTIYFNGEPLRNQRVLISGEEYITTDEGKVFLENLRGEVEVEYRGIRKRLKVKAYDEIHLGGEK